MAKVNRIAVIPGDGIGPEVINEGIKLLNHISELDPEIKFEFKYFPWGCDYYSENGMMMPENGLEILKDFDAILFGAVGRPDVPDAVSLRGLLIKIRQGFDQYVNLRPVKLLNGAPCPLKNKTCKDIDITFVRENSEGEYSGSGEFLNVGSENETAIQNSVFTRKGCQRIMRYAFEIAKREKKTVTSISKGNALNYSMVFWDKMFKEVASEYPEVKTQSYLVDAAAMTMVMHPEKLQVVVTTNLFGDILTDLGAAISGGMGISSGANLNPERKYPSMFEPIHGSAPDIAGKNIANPLATDWSVSQMLEFFGYKKWADKVLASIEKVLVDAKTLTPDMGGKATTSEVGDAVCNNITID